MAGNRQLRDSQSPVGETVLEVRDLDVWFQMDRGRSHVLDGVDLDVYRGETLGIVGESGSGKSMLASALLDGVQNPGVTSGEVTYYPASGEAVDVLDASGEAFQRFRWEEVSLVHQEAMSALNPTMTVEEHFEETLRAHDRDVADGMAHARELLGELKLDPAHVFGRYSHELSGGMLQRVLVAMALVLEPEVVVLDEPTSDLDILMQRMILHFLDALKDEYDLTLLLVSHDVSMVANFADRIGVVYAFELAEVGPPERVVYDSHHPYTRALLNAVPTHETPVAAQRPVPGRKPDPIDLPAGCKYHPRCPLTDERCETENPALAAVGDEHAAACFYADRVDDELPLALAEVRADE